MVFSVFCFFLDHLLAEYYISVVGEMKFYTIRFTRLEGVREIIIIIIIIR